MIDTQNLIYALIQVIHNFGAVMVIGIATYGMIRLRPGSRPDLPSRPPLLILTIAWAIQGTSGAMFGIASLYFNGELPDIHGVAVNALIIKMTCVAIGFVLTAFALWRITITTQQIPPVIWPVSLLLGATAISAAAFLRWFS